MKIKLGTQLTLEPTFTEKTEKYQCKVVDIDEQYIYIDYPMDTITNRTIFLMEGMQLRATFVEETKAVYAFQTEVLGKVSKQIPMVKLALPPESEFLRIQRRDFVRVNTSVDIAIQFEEERYQFVTDDISAGGTAVILNKEVNFKAHDEVTLLIPLLFNNGDIKYVTTLAHVVRIFEKGSLTIASLQFTDTDDLDKQQIVRFCFERQLLIRKKTLS